jgi:putative intracellular protease/amidase
MTTVLIVLTGAKVRTMKNGFPHPTGFWVEEFMRPHSAFTSAGLDVGIATPLGRVCESMPSPPGQLPRFLLF